MDPLVISGLIGAGASLIGNGVSNWLNSRRNKTLDERDDTSIQRRMKDLEAAGLNPYLALGQGAGTSQGISMNLDTSQLGNTVQSLYDLKNNREMYKQNQLYTAMLERQLKDMERDAWIKSVGDSVFFNGGKPIINPVSDGKADRLGNYKWLPYFGLQSYDTSTNDYSSNVLNGPYYQQLKNEANFDLNQSLFNLKTQGYMNGLELTKDTIAPLIDLTNLLNPISSIYQAVNGRKNYNTSTFNGTWQSNNTNHNYNYRQR